MSLMCVEETPMVKLQNELRKNCGKSQVSKKKSKTRYSQEQN